MHLPRTARSRHLGHRLKALRTGASLTVAEVMKRTRIAKSTMHRIETGEVTPHQRTLRELLEVYRVEGQEHADLLALADSSQSAGGWLTPYSGYLPNDYLDFVAFESDARSLQTYEGLLIPGLLQTEDYSRAIIAAGMLTEATSTDVDRRVELRQRRLEVMTKENPVGLHAVIDEAALWRVVGSKATMSAQLHDLNRPRPNVRLQVIPFGAGAYPGMIGPFVYMKFALPEATDLVYCENPAGELFREAEADLLRFQGIFDVLTSRALTVEESAALIESAARKHKRGG